ncbi:unnamed protein product [Moneuplotes crassus]|uniref:Uncharacterized protein n=1 Tax=Euplotes crassus TaxID=5936 RepID=A0AAD1XGK2_EUPCR|nr:unnamed protein product [Moneuplotes crassus]
MLTLPSWFSSKNCLTLFWVTLQPETPTFSRLNLKSGELANPCTKFTNSSKLFFQSLLAESPDLYKSIPWIWQFFRAFDKSGTLGIDSLQYANFKVLTCLQAATSLLSWGRPML